jgi:hypothetical protein
VCNDSRNTTIFVKIPENNYMFRPLIEWAIITLKKENNIRLHVILRDFLCYFLFQPDDVPHNGDDATQDWLSVLKLPLQCAVVWLYSVVKQRLKCNTGKVCNCLIQFLLNLVVTIKERVFVVEYVFPEGNRYTHLV